MKNHLILLSLLGCVFLSHAQTIKVKFKVSPSPGARISVDEVDKGLAHNQTIVLGFNERKGIVEHRVVIKKPGFEEQVYFFDPTADKKQEISCELERSLPNFKTKQDFYIQVEKVVSGLEYSSDVGANTRWKFRYNEEIDLSSRARKIDDAFDRSGLRTPNNSGEDLFDVHSKKVETPDILIAGRVEGFNLERVSTGPYGTYNSNIEVNWQLFDRHKKEIILKKRIDAEHSFQGNLVSDEFYNAVLESFYALMNSKEFVAAIDAYELPMITQTTSDSTGAEDSTTVPVDLIGIPRVRLHESDDFSDLVKLAMNASVTVLVDEKGHGSGVVVSPNGYIVTNHHVIDGASLVDVQFANGITLPADIITYSSDHDLALIKVRASGLTALPINQNPDDVREGAEVFVVGAPADRELGQSVSKGILSGKRTIDRVKVLQTDTKISPGNSGSPLIDKRGQVIGIINMKVVGEGVEGLSFAIDSRYLFNVLGLSYE
ncbi:MAG: S1C family serine protease [Flavobacteriales bacterium]